MMLHGTMPNQLGHACVHVFLQEEELTRATVSVWADDRSCKRSHRDGTQPLLVVSQPYRRTTA